MHSMSKDLALSGPSTPGSSRCGRILAYCTKAFRIGRSSPCSETESGTSAGQPTAPSSMASKPRSASIPSAGIIAPVCL